LFNPRLGKALKRFIPVSLFKRLDPFETRIREFVVETAGATPRTARVLDAGAGETRFKPDFAHARYVAVDSAQGDTSWNYSSLDAVAKLEDLPFSDASFDRVISTVVLEHLAEPGRAIEEFRRVLAPGGTVHLVVPYLCEEHQLPHDYFRFTSNGIRYLLERSGFRVQRIEPIGGFFWMLGRRLMAVLSFVQKGWRWIFFPVLAPVFGLVLPLCCYYLDALDGERTYTLGYICEGSKD
jgi:SAM-dependent methyltransferase